MSAIYGETYHYGSVKKYCLHPTFDGTLIAYCSHLSIIRKLAFAILS